MACFTGNIRSETLKMETQLSVILPHDRSWGSWKAPCRVLYLLHGLGQNASCWQRFSHVEWLLRDEGVAVIMPEVQRSFYCDMAKGPNYYTYLTEELPDYVRRMFNVSGAREDTFIMGLSMGGFGALKCALSRPDLYAGAASFSGAVSMDYVVDQVSDRQTPELQAILGEDLPRGGLNDLAGLAGHAIVQGTAPRLLCTCGLQDSLLEINRAFAEKLRGFDYPLDYREWEGGHDWAFWNKSLELGLDSLPGLKNSAIHS